MENENTGYTSIKNWAEDERPREKMLTTGAESLSNAELLAILINNGSREKSAVDLAREVMRLGNNKINEVSRLDLKALQQIKGIGKAKAVTIAAALELGRRRHAEGIAPGTRLTSVAVTAEYLRTMLGDLNHEVFVAVFINNSQKVLGMETLSEGGITTTIVDTRILLKKALLYNATGIVVCHNHPSGSLTPSNADRNLTEKLKKAAELLDIKVIDHIIVSDEGFYSFAAEGAL